MMSAPDAHTSSGRIALTVAAVPTGMNAGVRISPRCIAITPVRAAPSLADMLKEKRVTQGAMPSVPLRVHFEPSCAKFQRLFDCCRRISLEGENMRRFIAFAAVALVALVFPALAKEQCPRMNFQPPCPWFVDGVMGGDQFADIYL